MVRKRWHRRYYLHSASDRGVGLQILGLFLFSKDGQVRHQPFYPGRVNIVSGAPGTGKSTILHIVDHCLGGSNEVPARIRKVVSWYGIILQTHESQVVIAKPDIPGVGSTSDAFLSVGAKVDLPAFSDLIVNSNDTAIRELLNGLLGISSADIELPEASTRSAYDVTIRHALRLSLQPQGEIARNDILFHDQSNHFVAQSIRDTLPVFLGLVTAERLFLSRRLRRIQIEIADVQSEMRLGDFSSPASFAMLDALIAEASNVGLIAFDDVPKQNEAKLVLLRQVAAGAEAAGVESSSSDQALNGLREERTLLLTEYRDLREKYSFLQSFRSARDEYTQFATLQLERGEAIGLFSENAPSVCPLCGSDMAIEHLDELATSIRSLRESVGNIAGGKERYEHALLSYADKIDDVRNKLQRNQRAIALATDAIDRAFERQSLDLKQSMVRGRISLFCDTAGSSAVDSSRAERLNALRAEARRLELELSAGAEDREQEAVLSSIGERMTEIGKKLIFEYTGFGLFFDLKRLTSGAQTASGQETLRQIGSAANWLAFHIITHLALHDWFVRKNRPTPRFLLLDQPTQAYYPPDARDAAKDLTDIDDEDRRAVAALFDVLLEFPQLYDGEFQVIVLDHAELSTSEFQRNVVARWRDGEALVPAAWFDNK